MVALTEVAANIYHIDPDLDITPRVIAYVIAGRPAALVEPGPTAAAPAILEALHLLGQDIEAISYIMPTHIHVDHAGGCGYLARQWPRARVLVHQRGAPHLAEPARLVASTKMAFGDDFEDRFGPILPVPEHQLHIAQDGETISLGDRELKIIYAPGHAPHHLCIFDSRTRGLFSGEALGYPPTEGGPILPTAVPPSFDLEAALETFEALRALDPAILFYSHDGVSQEVSKSIESGRDNTKLYADIILEAMKAGEGLEQITEKVEARLWGGRGGGRDFRMLVAGYVSYFQRKNLA